MSKMIYKSNIYKMTALNHVMLYFSEYFSSDRDMTSSSNQSLSLRKPLWNLTLSPLAKYGLQGRSRIVPYLQLFGCQTPDERELNSAMAPGFWEDDVDLLFAVTKVDKLFMARQFNWNREECRKLRSYYKSIKLEYLEPF